MSINRRVHKDVAHIYNVSLLRYKKKCFAVYRDMNGPRDYHTDEVSQKERKKSYNITHMQNKEKWYRWAYLWSRNRDMDIENGCSLLESRGVGWIKRLALIYIHHCV